MPPRIYSTHSLRLTKVTLLYRRTGNLRAVQLLPTERHHAHFGDGVTDNGKGILSDLPVRHDVVRQIDIALVDLALRNKLIDIDGARAFNLNGLELLVLDNEILTFADLIPRAVSSRGTTSPVSESTFCCLSRCPVFRLMRLKPTFPAVTRPGRERLDRKRGKAEGTPSSSRAGLSNTLKQ